MCRSALSFAIAMTLIAVAALRAQGQDAPRSPVAMEVALAAEPASTGMATVYVRNPGTEEVRDVVVRVLWYSDALAAKESADVTGKAASVPPGATVPVMVMTAPAAYAQRVVKVTVSGVPSTWKRFLPPAEPRSGAAPAQAPFPARGTGTPPSIRKRVPPEYPAVARGLKQQGEVRLALVAGLDGRVTDIIVLTPTMFLDDAAAAAARQWEFQPPILNGRPFVLQTEIPFTFKLTDPPAATAPAAPAAGSAPAP